MNDQRKDSPAKRASSRLPVKPPHVDIKEAAKALGERLAAVGRWFLKDPLNTGLIVASLVLTILFFNLLGQIQPASNGEKVALSEVIRLTDNKQVEVATLLDQDSRVVIDTANGRQVYAAYPSSDAQTNGLIKQLTKGGAIVTVDQQADKPSKQILVQFLIPILLLVCLFVLFTRIGQDGGAGAFAGFSKFTGKGRKRGAEAPDRTTFDNVAGAGEAVAELREIRDYLADPSKYAKVGARAPKGVLLVGPPGTGKTLLAKATAGEADAAFFSLSGSDFVESLVGVGAARVRDLFAKARKMAPALIFIDELDAAGRKRGAGVGQGNDEREQTLNAMLVEMDGFGGDAGVVVLAATNRPDILDPALLRPGRFDRQVTVDVPDVHGRLDILTLHCGGRPLAPGTSLEQIAKLTSGFSGAELANVINEAALLTVREGQTEMDQATLEEAIDRVVAGPARKSHVLTEEERWVIAIHESAHAVVIRSTGQKTSTQKLSIVARGRQMGTAANMLTDRDAVVMQEPDMRRHLIAIVSGFAAEKIEFGVASTGVHDDLHAATAMARQMVTSYGMSDELGPVTIGEKAGEVFLGASLQELGSVGPATLELIDREVERIIKDSVATAEEILRANWSAVYETANALVETETLSGHALDAVLTSVKPTLLALGGIRDEDGETREFEAQTGEFEAQTDGE
ncbi:MAG TPA: ATP-dependent zinc metalloprotease FtsH [Solirubrobacterales bacterium]|nr:ATP-dependent zinc metalloprotease FtsH [Solirubrobacterales bacterium]